MVMQYNGDTSENKEITELRGSGVSVYLGNLYPPISTGWLP